MREKSKHELNNSFRLIIKSAIFVFIGLVLSKIFSYIYRIITARTFGPEVYGLFSLAITIFLWFVMFFSFGLLDGILRFIPLYRGKKNLNKIKYVFKISAKILLLTSIFSGILLYVASEFISLRIFHNPNLIIFLRILSISMPFFMLAYAFLALIQAYERIKIHTFISDVLQNFFKALLLIIFIFIGFKTNSIILSYVIAVILIFLISYIYSRKKISEVFGKCSLDRKSRKELIKELFYYSWPLIFFAILQGILPNIGSFVIGYFKNASDVGIYNAAVPIAELITFVPLLFTRIFFPMVTREFSKRNFSVVTELSKQIQKWILIINLPLTTLMVVFPGVFINILFGAEYLAAENSLRFLALALFFSSMSMVLMSLISMAGKSKLILINTIIASALNLLLDVLLIKKYGLTGVAFATMICSFCLFLILFFQVKKHTSIIVLRRKMLNVSFSLIIPIIFLVYVRKFFPINLLTIVLQGIAFLLLYIFFLFITKGLDKNDIMIVKTIKDKISNFNQ